jgi:hypothetical protein
MEVLFDRRIYDAKQTLKPPKSGKMAMNLLLLLCATTVISCTSQKGASTENISSEKSLTAILRLSPIGDNTNEEIFYFITDYILKQNEEKRDMRKLAQCELKNDGNMMLKSYIAEVVETTMSHLLCYLCRAHLWCHQITIFAKDGVAIASGGTLKNVVFSETLDDVYERLGFLYPSPTRYIGIKKMQDSKSNLMYFKIVKAIYYSRKQNYAYFLMRQKNSTDELIGYISYIVKSVD